MAARDRGGDRRQPVWMAGPAVITIMLLASGNDRAALMGLPAVLVAVLIGVTVSMVGTWTLRNAR